MPPDLKSMSDSQIEQKIVKLNSVYFMTADENVRHQILLLLDTFKLELEERTRAAKKKQAEDGNDLDSLINVS